MLVPGWRGDTLAERGPLPRRLLDALAAPPRARAARSRACAPAPTHSGRRACSTVAAAPPTTSTRTSWHGATRGRTSCATCLFTVDDRVVTSAGIASGIDLALHLVATRHGPAEAARIARTMVVYARRNGEAAQESAMLRHRVHLSDHVHRAQDLIDARYSAAAAAGRTRPVGRSQRTHADPPVRPGHRADPAALPADPASRAGRDA